MRTEAPPSTPVQAGRAPARPALPRIQLSRSQTTAVIAVAIFALALFANTYRSVQAIDMNSDEATYAIESAALLQTGMTMWNGTPFFVHPPVFFMIEAAWFQMRGVGQGQLFHRLVAQPYHFAEALLPPTAPLESDNVSNAIAVGRFIPALSGALIAVLLFLMGQAFLNRWVGLLGAGLFIFDPYVLRRNHFNMLEPLATLFGVLAIYVFYKAMARPDAGDRRRYLVGTGLLLGVALLSKELAGLYLVGLAFYWLLFRRTQIADVLLPGGIALALYSLFPLWAAATGNWGAWWSTKRWLLLRLTGQIQDTGLTRPNSPIGRSLGFNFLDYLPSLTARRFLLNMADYLPSFFILGVAGLTAVGFLYLYFRRGIRDRPAALLAACVLGCDAMFAAVWKMGGVLNEQFFYFVMPFSVLLIVYSAWRLPTWITRARGMVPGPDIDAYATRAIPWVREDPRRSAPTQALSVVVITRRARAVSLGRIVVAALLILGIYNVGAAMLRYGLSQDDSYVQIDSYLAQNTPPGSAVVGRDALDIYLMPRNQVYTYSVFPNAPNAIVPWSVIENRIPYAILNGQSELERYSGANPGYYKWVAQHGTPVDVFRGRIWDTSVYYLDYSKLQTTEYEADSLGAHRPAVASSTEDAGTLGAQNAFDGRATTRWASAVGPTAWIYVDLGQVRTFHHVELTWETAYAESYAVQVSNDAKNWTSVYQTAGGHGGFEAIDVTGTGRYVRVLCTKRGTPWGYSLWEVGIFP